MKVVFDVLRYGEPFQALRIYAKQIPKLPRWKSENYNRFDINQGNQQSIDDDIEYELKRKNTSAFARKLNLSIQQVISEMIGSFSNEITMLIINLSEIERASQIDQGDWKQLCLAIRNNLQQLASLKVVGPLNCFMGEPRVEYDLQDIKKLEPSICQEVSKFPTTLYFTRLECLLKACCEVQNLHFERVGACEETFWQIGKLHRTLRRLIIKGIDDPHVDMYQAWFALVASICEIDKLLSVTLSHIIFYHHYGRSDLIPPWEYTR